MKWCFLLMARLTPRKTLLVSFALAAVALCPAKVLGQDRQTLFKQGMTAKVSGDFDTAIADFTQVIQIDPKADPVYYQRASAYAGKGAYDKAVLDLTQAIQINPKNLGAYNDLAWILATAPQDNLRDGKKAVEYANQACQLSGWKIRATLDTLAAAYAEAGDFENAINLENKILAIPQLPQAAEANAQSRLKLYELRQPYRMAK
jgi:tetratricopeptide (TPR) repeat protein